MSQSPPGPVLAQGSIDPAQINVRLLQKGGRRIGKETSALTSPGGGGGGDAGRRALLEEIESSRG
jgi:hypothetical protein